VSKTKEKKGKGGDPNPIGGSKKSDRGTYGIKGSKKTDKLMTKKGGKTNEGMEVMASNGLESGKTDE